jgi:hypothetical protein
MDIARTEPHPTRIASRRNDGWARKPNNLGLALATFALQLDAFEMRTYESRKAGVKPEVPVPAPDAG